MQKETKYQQRFSFVPNGFGLTQKRLENEQTLVGPVNSEKAMKHSSVFNPENQFACEGFDPQNGKMSESNKENNPDVPDVSLFVALDCEMDQSNSTSAVCKVSLVDESGQILVDTLVNSEMQVTRSMSRIHGIRQDWLQDAPTISAVRAHIKSICEHSIFIGHSVKHDLQALGVMDVRYIDTSMFEDKGKPEELEFKRTNPKKLKELTAIYLNAQIQEATHSSIIDARAAMALFKYRQDYLEGRILYLDSAFCEQSMHRSRKKKQLQTKPSNFRSQILTKTQQNTESGVNMIKHCQNGNKINALAAAHAQQMLKFNSKFRMIKDDRTYKLDKNQLKLEIDLLTQQILSDLFAVQKLM